MEAVIIIQQQTSINLNKLRELCDIAKKDYSTCEKLYNQLKNYTATDKTIDGYKALISFLMANHVFNPFYKMHYFNEGKKILNTAILQDPQNVELRFLRYVIQSELPEVLGYTKNIYEDKEFIIHSIKENTINDTNLLQRIQNYFKEHKEQLNNNEIKTLKL